jgi:hypothetical protein
MATSIPPLLLEASAFWAGNDGNWSTWSTQVGEPPQRFHVLPSTSHGEVWIPGPQGCTSRSVPFECAASRGVGYFQNSQSLGFLENASTTWEQIGIYEFIVGGDLFEETETGLYGQDEVVIGENGTRMKNQTVAGIVTQDFWVSVDCVFLQNGKIFGLISTFHREQLGSFGLHQTMSEFPVRNGSLPSLLDGMKQANLTESTSFGLATGASYSVSASVAIQIQVNQQANVRSQNRVLVASSLVDTIKMHLKPQASRYLCQQTTAGHLLLGCKIWWWPIP